MGGSRAVRLRLGLLLLLFLLLIGTLPNPAGGEIGSGRNADALLEFFEDEALNNPFSSSASIDNRNASLVNGLLPGVNGTGDSPTEPPPPPPRVPFSAASVNESYRAALQPFEPRGMEHLYFITNFFLQAVHRDEEMPPELSALVDRETEKPTLDKAQALRVVKALETQWESLALHYVGLVLLVVLGILIAIVMPIAGLVFACCRCGGRCGAPGGKGGPKSQGKKTLTCKRVTLGTLLATFIVVVLLGLVCSFVTNARLEKGVIELPDRLEMSIEDSKLYLNNTHKEIKTLCETNFQELQKVLFNKLDRSGELMNLELARVSKAIAISNLTAIAASLGDIRRYLHIIRNTTVQLQQETSGLQSGLLDVANRLRRVRSNCEHLPQCLVLIDKYSSKLEINNNFYKLPSVTTKLDEVSALIDNNIEVEVKSGKNSFDSIAREIQSKVETSIPDIKLQIENTGYEMRNVSRELGRRINRIDFAKAQEYIQVSRHYINEYSMYRYWYFLLVCVILLIITLCFTMGVAFGCCGRRRDEASSCHKTSGASWLMWGVGLTFLFSAVLMLTATLLFVVGSLSELIICDPLRDPSNSEVFNLAQSKVDLKPYFPQGEPPQLDEVIQKCHRNMSLYSALNLHETYDSLLQNMSNYRDFLRLDEKIGRIKIEVGQSIDTNVQILSKEAKQQLNHLATSSVADKDSWHYYTDILEQEVLSIDLLDLAAQLNQTAAQLPPDFGAIGVKLKNDAIFLEGLRRWLTSIKRNARTLKKTTQLLSEALKFNHTSLREAIQDLMRQAEFAQTYLRVNGSEQVVQLVSRFTDDFLGDVDFYVSHLRLAATEGVGRCGPLSAVYNSSTDAVCKHILYPFNGFWASVGWCFLLFLPCLVIAIHLSALYRDAEPYVGALTESHESMYDAFAERDNIPLTSGCDKKPGGGRRSRDMEEGSGRGRGAYGSETVACAPPQRQDYHHPPTNDWSEYPPGGGPPRYTSQPSLSPEYERPPPYYYPGPGNS